MSSQTVFVTKATTDFTCYVDLLQDNSGTNPGDPLTGLVYNSTGLVCYYVRPLAAAVQLTLATQTVTGAHSDGGFVEVSAATPGKYRLDLSDAILATGVDGVTIELSGFADLAPHTIHVVLTDVDLYDSTYVTPTGVVDLNADQSGVTIGTVNNVTGLATGTGGISVASESFTATVAGTPTNDYTDTRSEDGTYHIVPPSVADTDIYYQFDIGASGVPQSITWVGYAQSNGDSYTVYGYNYGLTSYEQIGTITAANGTNQMTESFEFLVDHVGTGADAGKVRFRILSADGTTFATDRLFCTYTQALSGIPNGSTITLAAAVTNQNFVGHNWNLALGGQTISGAYFFQATSVTGTGVIANGNPATFQECNIGTATLGAYFFAEKASLSDTLTLTSTSGVSADTINLIQCNSGIAGDASPTIDASGVTKTTNIQNRKWGGGFTCSINSFCVLSHEVTMGGGVTLTNAGGDAEIRGAVKSLTVTSSGAATTDFVCTSGAPVTVNGTGGTVNIYGMHNGITDNSGATVTINDLGVDVTLTDAEAVWDRVLTGATHNIADSAGRRVRNLQEFGSYENDSVWIDTVAGSAGTTDYESGTILNKVDSIADANTIAASLGLNGRAIIPGSTITLAASQDNQNFWGNNWTLALGGQSVSATHIRGAAVSGICTGATEPEFHECLINAVTVPPCRFIASDIDGVVTLPVGEVHFHGCAGEAGGALDFGAAIANTTAYWTHFSGEIAIDNLGQLGTDILYLAGEGRLMLNASCVAGTIYLDGHITVVNNGSGMTINNDYIALTSAAILEDTGTTIPGLINSISVQKNATFSNFEFLMVLASDHVTPATGLTVTGQRSIDGAAFAGVGGAIAEVSNGIYQFDALAADTNGDVITWRFSEGTADDTFVTFKTVA